MGTSKTDNKAVFAANLKRYMELHGKTRNDVCKALGVSYYTFTDWVNAKKYPRMDKVEKLANYFGVLKSDLIEDKSDMQKNNDALASIIIRMRKDSEFFSLVESMMDLDGEQIKSVKQLLSAFLK